LTTDNIKDPPAPNPVGSQPQVPEPEKPKKRKDTEKPPAKTIGPVGTVLLTLYIALISIVLFYGIPKLWPSNANQETILFWTIPIGAEARMILLVGMAGALGSMVHVLRSFYWYLGTRELVVSWWAKYIFLPFVGATLGIIFYLVVRGGFFSPQATIDQTMPFSFVAIAALVGMFSEAAISKLKEVAETLLKAPEKGDDATKAKEVRGPQLSPPAQPGETEAPKP
jgi:hypothetical protein